MRHTYITIALLSSAVLCAQEYLPAPRFPKTAYFRRHFAERMPHVELQAPRRLEDFVIEHTLKLSLRSYLELVLANNTEIQIQRLSIEPERNDITRAFAPFDAFVTASFQSMRSTTPSYSALDGAATLSRLQQPLHFAYQRTLENGTQYAIGFDTIKTSSNDEFAIFNPALTANFNVAVTQPLLRNRGTYINRLPILIARTRYRMSLYNLEDQLTRLLQVAEDIYWAAVEARENLRVQQDALELLRNSLQRYQRELELGEIAPVEMYQPEQVCASEEVLVNEARSHLQQTEDALRREIGADMTPEFRNLPLMLTESILPASEDEMLGRDVLVEKAFQKRADLRAIRQALDIDDMAFELSKNALLPDLSLKSTYSSTGLGGQFSERANLLTSDASVSEVFQTRRGGLGEALGQLFGLGFPTYSVALNLRFPIRDRKAAADLADATVSKRLDALRVRAVEQQIRLEVLNAATQVEASRASVKLAQVSADFARKRLDAEERKYDLGATTIYFLLDAQNSLTRAEAEFVAQSVQYRHNLVNLLRATGSLPETRSIEVQ